MVELLAPAGSKEAFIAAVEAGADAVYLAGSHFGARAYADNFDEETMRWAVRFAHLRGVRVHVTVNTIVSDAELPAVAAYLRFLYDAGVDAVLVQDLGVAALAREIVPRLPLHASTQMTIHNLAGVQAMERLGFTRVVLSRELSLAEIRYIAAHTPLEIEAFVHGALCVCYSGQCLMSSMIGGRSGNRGRCAQPCRLPYTLVDAAGEDVLGASAGKYLLSPKDMNTLEILPELLATGIASLKIEGRMKRPEYVATVVQTYRQALDRCMKQQGSNYQALPEEKERLAQIFNRDFTTAYLERRPGRAMMSDRRPNNRGLLIGRVVRFARESRLVSLRLSGRLAVGDQIDVWVKVGGRVTATIEELRDETGRSVTEATPGMTVSFPLSAPVHEHDRVFKVYDGALMQRAKSFYTHGAPLRRIPVDVRVTAAVGEPLRLAMTDEDGHHSSAATSFIGVAAQKRPLTEAVIRKQVERLGTSVFALRDFHVQIAGDVMVPMSEINEARRQAVASLEEARLKTFARPPLATSSMQQPQQAAKHATYRCSELVVSVDTLEKARAAYEAGADGVLFGGDSYQHRQIAGSEYEAVWELAEAQRKNLYFNTPRIVRECHLKEMLELFDVFREIPPDELYVQNIGTLEIAQTRTEIPLHTDASLIAYNHETLAFLAAHGVASATLSPELTWQQVKHLAATAPLPLECIVHGPLELMVSEYCALGSFLGDCGEKACSMPCVKGRYFLKDRKDVLFPLVTDQFCHMHVLNSRPLSMLPHAAAFGPVGIARIRIEGKSMTAEEIAQTVAAYRSVLAMKEQEREDQAERIARLEGENITRGHYFRGVE